MANNNTTTSTKVGDIKRTWYHLDAEDQILGRAATKVAQALIGKNKTYFCSHLDCGDYVVVTNLDKIAVTGKKSIQKKYYRHSGFPGGLREITLEKQLEKDSRKVFEHAIKGMLPKNKLRASMLKRLKLFVGEEHTFTDKKPQELK